MLGHKLKHTKIEVVRDYDRALPQLTVRGSELNQVWTNLLDNAIDALGDARRRSRSARALDGACVAGRRRRRRARHPGGGPAARLRARSSRPRRSGSGTGLGPRHRAPRSSRSATAARSASTPARAARRSTCGCRWRAPRAERRRRAPALSACFPTSSRRPAVAVFVELGDRDSQRLGEARDRRRARVLVGPLDLAQVLGMDVRREGERLLRQLPLAPQVPDRSGQREQLRRGLR